MAEVNALQISQLAVKVGLLTPEQVQDAWMELGERGGDADRFLRIMERKGYLTPYQSSKLLKGDTDGYFLGGYRLLYKIASGSFGRVFRAEDPQSGRVVAIKVLRRRWSDKPEQIAHFEREGKVGLNLRHPNIVEILAVSRDASTGQWFIVMEFVEGGNLREILGIRKKLEPAEALKIVEDAATGLAHAYSRGVTHRDMKLTNVLISSQGTAKLVDFGLAGIFSGMLLGRDDEKQERTVDYAGLERATGVKPGDVRSDIYFLGCVLYELLTGRSPLFMSRDRHQRMQKQRFDSVPPMGRDEVNGPPSLFHLVETMMSLEPQGRYQTPSQLLDAIRAVRRDLEGKGAGAGNGSSRRSVFVVEKDLGLQEKIRDKLKELGYRVYMAADPIRALDRYRQQPYDALIMDVGTVDEDGLLVFERILTEARRQERPCGGIVILSAEQADWKDRVPAQDSVAVFVRPVTLKQLHHKLQELAPVGRPAEQRQTTATGSES